MEHSDHLQRLRFAWRWERVVQLSQVGGSKREVDCGYVFADVPGRSRLRDCDDAPMPKHPRETDLRRRRLVPNGNALHDRMREQARLLYRRIRHYWHAAFLAPRQQIGLDAATAQIVENLI